MIKPTTRMVFTRDYELTTDELCSQDKILIGHWRHEAKKLLDRYPKAHCVRLVNRFQSG